MSTSATIFALSSGVPPSGIAVIRISGTQALRALERLTGRSSPVPRRASVAILTHPVSREILDHALVIWFPGPRTVTGDDIAELHLHGGRAVVAGVLDALSEMEHLSPAAPGAFTRRAYDNGRIDLAQVEGLGDLLAAETAQQRRNALMMSEGRLGQIAAAWRTALLDNVAHVEALLDFSDEGDVGNEAFDTTGIRVLAANVAQWRIAPSAERLRDGIRVVLAGPPNTGKSTLLNTLVGRDVAITSEIAGTTRDVVEASVVIDGVPLILMDTAGLHAGSSDIIEHEGMRRAAQAIEQADVILWMGEIGDCPDPSRSLIVSPRADLYPGNTDGCVLRVSAITGEGVAALRAGILVRAQLLLPSHSGLAINLRQRGLIAEFGAALERAHDASDLIVLAEELRIARNALDRLVGRVGVEDVLDTLFGNFCVGK